MARPRKQEHEKRNQRFNVRYTLAEVEHIRVQANAAGLSPHEYIRRRTLGYKVAASFNEKADPALISEVNRIGVNVNQLARATHRGSDFVNYWREIGGELKVVMRRLVKADGS